MRNNKNKDLITIYGKHATLAAIHNPNRNIRNIFCTEEIFYAHREIIEKFSYEILQQKDLSKMVGENNAHQGIIVKLNKTIFLNDISEINVSKKQLKIAILDQVTDPQNIGAIIRSAAAFEIDAIILQSDNSPEENGAIAKTASGALEIVPIIKVVNLVRTIEQLKKIGFWIIGMDGNSNNNLNQQLYSDRIAIIFGSEDKGIRPLVKKHCDFISKINMSQQIESLNVSNAASIVFHYFFNIQ
jgi:23S rRNA (guanosine2251-2'-O)-methyltransferase